MNGDFVHLADCKRGLTLSAVPAWVFDADTIDFLWANDLAVKLWRAESEAALLARDVVAGAPERVITRTRHIVERVRNGEVVQQEWTFYPCGKPTVVSLNLRGVLLDNGKLGVLNQALPVANVPDSLLRVSAVVRHTTVIATLVSPSGKFLSRNPAADRAFGNESFWTSCICKENEAEKLLDEALQAGKVHALTQVKTTAGLRWHRVDARSLRDPVTGKVAIMVEHFNETARVEAENSATDRKHQLEALRAALEVVEQQKQEILALSAPLLDVGAQTLAVPLTGAFGPEQSDTLQAKLLDAVIQRRTRRVILDLTGMSSLDSSGALRLLQILRALKLLGATPIVTGVQPQLVGSVLDSGLDREGVAIFRTLATGLADS